MKHAVILHGTHGRPEGNWFPWLQSSLGESWNVTIPSLPTPEGQNLENWIIAFQKQVPHSCDLFIGHSLGATFILKLIEQGIIHHPAQAIIVSAVIDNINILEYDLLNNSFIQDDIDYAALKNTTTQFTIIHGDNDPYVPLNQAQQISDALGVKLHIIKKGGHINSESGYNEFPAIMDFIYD